MKTVTLASALCAIALGGCAAYTSATTTIEELSKTSKGAVVMMASFDGVPIDRCSIISVETGGNAGAEASRKVRSRDYPNPGFWILDPGSYEVKAVNCLDGLNMPASAGYGNYVVLAKFSVSAGEVLNLGHLVVGGEFKNRTLKVEDFPADAIEDLNREFPKLAIRMTKKYMTVDAASTSAQEVNWEKNKYAAFRPGALLRAVANAPIIIVRHK